MQAIRENKHYALQPLNAAVELPDNAIIGRDLGVLVPPHVRMPAPVDEPATHSPYGLPCVESCFSCKLRFDNFFCAALSQESLVAFNQIKHAAVFPKGAVIFLEGQTPRGVFLLSQGQAKLSITSRDGKTFILRMANPGEVLGLDAVVTGRPYRVTAETMQPSQLNFVNREEFLRFLKEHSDAGLHAAQHISRYCQDLYDVVRSVGLSQSASERVAKLLLASATDGRVANGVVYARFTLTHEDIAQLTGVSRETITRTLSQLRKKCIVELKGSSLIIYDKSALERLVVA
jgi:CRP/FNR family transcriptional regulator